METENSLTKIEKMKQKYKWKKEVGKNINQDYPSKNGLIPNIIY